MTSRAIVWFKERYLGYKFYSRQERAAYVARYYGDYLAGRVLDVGSGGAGLAEYVSDCIGIDVNPAAYPNVFVDLERGGLPFVSDSFDCIVCLDVLEHLESLHFVFGEMLRVSRKYLLVSLPNNWLGARSAIHWGRYTKSMKYYGLPVERPHDRHHWFFGYAEAEDFVYGIAAGKGLDVVRCSPYFGARNQVKAMLLRPWMSPRRIGNLFASSLWAVFAIQEKRN